MFQRSAASVMRLLELVWHGENPEPVVLAVDWRRALAQGQLQLPILRDMQSELEVEPSATGDPLGDRASGEVESSRSPAPFSDRLRSLIAELMPRKQIDAAIPLVDQGLRFARRHCIERDSLS